MRTLTIHAAMLGAAAALLLAAEARAEGFRAMAKDLSKAAQRAGIGVVAVLPFEPADSTDAREGWTIAERLTTQVVRQRRVQAVERSLLKKVLEEHRLGRTGVLDAAKLHRLGRILAVDAIVTGSFVSAGNQAVIDARVVNVETGLIVAAIQATADRDWHDPLGLSGRLAPIPLDPHAFGGPDGEPPLLPPPPVSFSELPGEAGFRDSLGQAGCAGAAEQVDRLEAGILALKARYWASQLKAGAPVSSVRSHAAAVITDPALKRRFYEETRSWYARSAIPALTPSEVKRFIDMDQRAFQLHQECGL